MIINIDQFEYVSLMTDTAGVRLQIDSQGAMPFPEDFGVSVGPGVETSIGIQLVRWLIPNIKSFVIFVILIYILNYG